MTSGPHSSESQGSPHPTKGPSSASGPVCEADARVYSSPHACDPGGRHERERIPALLRWESPPGIPSAPSDELDATQSPPGTEKLLVGGLQRNRTGRSYT